MKRLAPLILAVPLLLAGCATDADESPTPETTTEAKTLTDWADPDEKITTFSEHICARDGIESSMEPYTQSAEVAVGVLAEPTSTQEDKMIALDISTRPADAYEQDVAWAEAAGEPVPDDVVPRTLTPNHAATCEGWVWEKHLEQAYLKEYEDFTFEEARRAGAI